MEPETRISELIRDLSATEVRIREMERELEDFRSTEIRRARIQKRYRLLLNAISSYVYTVMIEDGAPSATYHNPQCEQVTGYTHREYEQDCFLWLRMVHPDDRNDVLSQIREVLSGKTPKPLEHRLIHKNGRIRWIRNTIVPLLDDQGRLISYDGVVEDITERKRDEEEREKLILELRDALSRIKRLQGLLPICSNCKKIRDDRGYWEKIEIYIHDHSEAQFSHSLCPECAKALYPEIDFDEFLEE